MKVARGLFLLVIVGGCAHMTVSEYGLGREHSREAVALPDWEDMLDASYRYLFESQPNQVPQKPLPVHKLTKEELAALPNDRISAVRFGHSTVLVKINGQYWLTDPVFSKSLGPIYAMGIERFHEVPLSITDLPEIQGVLISHDHYDHLDEQSIKALRHKVAHFLVPSGNGKDLVEWGVKPAKITELDWWEEIHIEGMRIVATPANHLSGRMLIDQNQSLWSSWIIQHENQRVYFSGDGGYSSVFREIGERYGPFDLTLMENGSYDHCWAKEHLTPSETVQAHIDLKGEVMMPIHNSTFDLAFHQWNEPLESVSDIAREKAVPIATPVFGQAYTVGQDTISLAKSEQIRWWN